MKSALLIIDMQTALCAGQWAAFDIDNVVDRINSVSERARIAGIPVIVIQHEENEEPLFFNSDAWQLYERLVVKPEDIRIRKAGSDSFFNTELQSILQERGITNLIVCGLQSEFCVDSTVRVALAHGYPVILIGDGHSTIDNDILSAAQISAHHNNTLRNLGSYGPRVTITNAEQVRFDA